MYLFTYILSMYTLHRTERKHVGICDLQQRILLLSIQP